MPKQTFTAEIEVADGFEVTGEYRPAKKGEWHWNALDPTQPILASWATIAAYPILRKKRRPQKGEVWQGVSRQFYLVVADYSGGQRLVTLDDGLLVGDPGGYGITFHSPNIEAWAKQVAK